MRIDMRIAHSDSSECRLLFGKSNAGGRRSFVYFHSRKVKSGQSHFPVILYLVTGAAAQQKERGHAISRIIRHFTQRLPPP